MEIVTEQATAKLKLFPKPFPELTDEEVTQWLDEVIRPNRGKQQSTRKTKTPKPPGSASTNRGKAQLTAVDSIDDID